MPKGTPSYTEEELLCGIRIRDKEVLAYINKAYRPTLRLLIMRMGGSRNDAQDLFQEAIIELMKKTSDPLFKPDYSIKTLLCAIGKNKWKNRLRTLNREVPYRPEQHDPLTEPLFPEAQDLNLYEQLFWNTFRELPKSCKEILLLSFRNIKNSEIARILGRTHGYIRKRKSACTRKMREQIINSPAYRKLMGLPGSS
jgi:RNA polymerase sigma factor (sigma-70 family)